MRPLRVVMQAFGPYAGEQTIDFAELRGKSFFLITGPTGSGKTTVLDAMSFALYGVTSGGPENDGGRSGASMRSDHADPALLTRVEFDFALGHKLYRAVREPDQASSHSTSMVTRKAGRRPPGTPCASMSSPLPGSLVVAGLAAQAATNGFDQRKMESGPALRPRAGRRLAVAVGSGSKLNARPDAESDFS